jgi:hypothetical protein
MFSHSALSSVPRHHIIFSSSRPSPRVPALTSCPSTKTPSKYKSCYPSNTLWMQYLPTIQHNNYKEKQKHKQNQKS